MTDHEQLRQEPEKSKSNILLGVGLALLLVVSAFFSGMYIGTSEVSQTRVEAGLFSIFMQTPKAPDGIDLKEFWRVWDLLEEKYVVSSTTKSISQEERLEGAISGLVNSYGDPYTVFLPPVDAELFGEEISGNFSGVGMEVGLRDGLITVISPLPDTPAAKAGIVAQDSIIKIDDKTTEGMRIDEAVKLIRGEKGTEVVLTIYRDGETEFLEIPIIRDTIAIPTVETEVRDNVFIISLYSFNALSESNMREALLEFVVSGKENLVLDLRGNPGGFLQSSVGIASYFLPAGTPVVREGFGEGQEEEVFRSSGKVMAGYSPKDMVVLINGGSASASEILAGALQEHGVATLMGAQTFGKGSVQELVDLPSGASLKVTVARWFTPNGVSISEGGLTPDVLVERTPQQMILGEDTQLDAAVAWLNGDKTVGTTTASVSESE